MPHAPAPAIPVCHGKACLTPQLQAWNTRLLPLKNQAEQASNQGNAQALRDAIDHYLRIRHEFASDPLAQTVVSHHLSEIYRWQAEESDRMEPLTLAAAEAEKALSYYRDTGDIRNQIRMLGAIGNARMRMAERNAGAALADQAVAAFEVTFQLEHTAGMQGPPVPLFLNEYGNALNIQATVHHDAAPLHKAVDAYNKGIRASLPATAPAQRYELGVLYLGLGNTHGTLAEEFQLGRAYQPSQNAYRKAEEMLQGLDDNNGLAQAALRATRNNLAYNLYLMGVANRDPSLLQEAQQRTQALLEASEGSPSARHFAARHTRICTLIALGDLTRNPALRSQGEAELRQLKTEFPPGENMARYAGIRACEATHLQPVN